MFEKNVLVTCKTKTPWESDDVEHNLFGRVINKNVGSKFLNSDRIGSSEHAVAKWSLTIVQLRVVIAVVSLGPQYAFSVQTVSSVRNLVGTSISALIADLITANGLR